MVRQRMSGKQRREQLISIGRALFAERGYEGTSVEEIAARAAVSKPVIYEHFGGKEGLYAVVVDREMVRLEAVITNALDTGRTRRRIEQAVLALLTYVEEHTDGFQILVRDITPGGERTYSTLLNDAVAQVSHILGGAFEQRGLDPDMAVLYGQALVGMVSMTAQWWLDTKTPDKEIVAAHIVNLCWNGLAGMDSNPQLKSLEHPLETTTNNPTPANYDSATESE
ncbi:TetR/AcrR family transcriptional regulator [Corynebacterium aquilae]|uniref:TetR/AcrR family transcriptional regulator n=1 Tax=Corynebacterium aquilae TaxID=203263 RepID=UPI00095273F4|nr:TetR/AcrR family transcriptional regulator [Corynebacterium aquilae]